MRAVFCYGAMAVVFFACEQIPCDIRMTEICAGKAIKGLGSWQQQKKFTK